MQKSQDIVDNMMQQDAFSQWLGIEVLEVKTGSSKLQMTVRKEMTNGFGIAHGGITYSFADSAVAFASILSSLVPSAATSRPSIVPVVVILP